MFTDQQNIVKNIELDVFCQNFIEKSQECKHEVFRKKM